MRLSSLIKDIPHTLFLPEKKSIPDIDPEIMALSNHSGQTHKNALFFAIPGQKMDGLKFIPQSVNNGAVAVVAQGNVSTSVPLVCVTDILQAMSKISARYYRCPSDQMKIIGVTGTNGKTTVTYMLESIWMKQDIHSGIIGTVEHRWRGHFVSAQNTTPLSITLQHILAQMVDAGVSYVSMEVSSHALALQRVNDIDFDGAIFTNLTQDHLDFHHTLDHYFESKAILFQRLGSLRKKNTFAVINVDDPKSHLLKSMTSARVITYGIENEADFTAKDINLTDRKSQFKLCCSKGEVSINLLLIGRHNVSNALAAAAAAHACGLSLESIKRGLELLKGIPGRLERIQMGQAFSIFVDYAHTEDALMNVLKSLRPISKRKLITVFGCGGDRDKGKRSLMGKIATLLSDEVIVTSDNPRTEDPGRIARDIEIGITKGGKRNYKIILDRQAAIEEAVQKAHSGDVILVAGKGHETYQIVDDRVIPFDDRQVVRKYLAKAGYHKAVL